MPRVAQLIWAASLCPAGAQLPPLTLPKSPSSLTTDRSTRVFMVTGALAGITARAEQDHP
jgi:hypothetical protein